MFDVRRKSFTVKVVRRWHRFPKIVDATSWAVFKVSFDGALSKAV